MPWITNAINFNVGRPPRVFNTTIRARSPTTPDSPHAASKLINGNCRSRQVTCRKYHGGASLAGSPRWKSISSATATLGNNR
eukprot:gene1561-1822_t